jgi:uncharacterized protein YjbI with pentapeptide repeats
MDPTVVAAWIAAGISVLTLAGTLAAQYLGYRATSRDAEKTAREQREYLDRTLAEQRTRTLNERFTTAAEQLGSDKPGVRLAGVYAMAGLADDWEKSRQTCVDVLCAYLRMPYEPDPGQDSPEPRRQAFRAFREVRHTVIRVITVHLQYNAEVSWQGLDLDFTGVVFDGGDFSFAQFAGGTVHFTRARFPGGEVYFNGARFSGGAVNFDDAEFSGATLSFWAAQFAGGDVSFHDARFSGGEVNFDGGARFSDGTVTFNDAKFCGGAVNFDGGFTGASVLFGGAKFSGGTVNFSRARFAGGEVIFAEAQFSGGTVNFADALFTGGAVNFASRGCFGGAEFSGGEVDFSPTRDWSHPPQFPWTGTPPPGVKLPKKEDQPKA